MSVTTLGLVVFLFSFFALGYRLQRTNTQFKLSPKMYSQAYELKAHDSESK